MAACEEMVKLRDSYLVNWARVLAGEYGGRMMPGADEEVLLKRESDRWREVVGEDNSISLSETPADAAAWRIRLQHVEKRIAQSIISAPVAFSCSFHRDSRRRGKGRERGEVVRFAFGLSLSLGTACQRRYTAYYVTDIERIVYWAGQDRLFESCSDIGPADLDSKQSSKGLRRILQVIPEAIRDYEASELVRGQLKLLNKAVSSEIRDLDRFYIANSGQYAKLLGPSHDSIKGDDAIELEYLSKLEDIVGRYTMSVRFTPLSLGLVRCSVMTKQRKGGTEIKIPFVDHVFFSPP